MKILIIEDETFISSLLKSRILRLMRGFETVKVSTVETLEQGVKLAASLEPHIIILDLGLTDSSPEETVQKCNVFTHTSSVIVVSAALDDTLIKEAYDRGAYKVLDKLELNLGTLRGLLLKAYVDNLKTVPVEIAPV